MKYAIILPDGAADEPVESLGAKTPLEVAKTPNMDWISTHGRQGRVVTVPHGFLPGSDVATLSLLGYDPNVDYPGRAPLEAAARGVAVEPGELIFRCNFVTLMDARMEDFTAGHIGQQEADRLVEVLNNALKVEKCRLLGGLSYRNLLVMSDMKATDVQTTPPHDFPDEPVDKHQPRGAGAARLIRIMECARSLLAQHEINLVRSDLGENPATDIWLWGQGGACVLDRFEDRHGVRSAVIAAVDLIRGIGCCAGLTVLDVKGATGFLDTDYVAKGLAAVEALDEYDLVIVHVEAPDEAGHLGDVEAKIEAIERVDADVVGPVLEKLRSLDAWKILVAPDHPTPVEKRVHTSEPPPFCLAGTQVQTVLKRPFSEKAAAMSDLQVDPGHELMEYFIRS